MASKIPKLKFSANISSLFVDIPDHIESYQHILSRKDFQFQAVEAQDPYQNPIEKWREVLQNAADAKPKFVLINSINIIKKYGTHIPTEQEFDSELKILADYIQALNVPKVHLLLSDAKNQDEFEANKKLLVHGCRFLQNHKAMCLIEPLSIRDNYYLRSYDQALKLCQELKEPNLKIMFDTFHCQKLHGNLCHYMDLVKDHIGHVQISQVPLRDNPMHDGELNHHFILNKISSIYDDFIGLEYYNSSEDAFDWVSKYV